MAPIPGGRASGIMGDELLIEILKQRGYHILIVNAVDVNLESIVSNLYLPLNALDEMLVDTLWLHREEVLGRICYEVNNQMVKAV